MTLIQDLMTLARSAAPRCYLLGMTFMVATVPRLLVSHADKHVRLLDDTTQYALFYVNSYLNLRHPRSLLRFFFDVLHFSLFVRRTSHPCLTANLCRCDNSEAAISSTLPLGRGRTTA